MANFLSRLLERQLPHAYVESDNPLFDYEMRKLGDKFSPPYLVYPLKNLVIAGSGISVLLWVLLFLCRAGMLASPSSSGPGEVAFGIGATIASVTAFVAFATSIGADLYYVMVSINGINWLAVGDRLDLVRLTSMGDEDILAAGYALIQLRVWSMTFFEVAIRIVGIMFILAPAIFQVLFGRRDPYTPSDLGQLGTIAGVAVVAALAATYILEPIWRMRAFIALGLSLAVRRNTSLPNAVVGIGTLFGARMVQLGLLAALNCGTLSLISRSPSVRISDFTVITLLALNVAVIYGFYRGVQLASLRFIIARAFRAD